MARVSFTQVNSLPDTLDSNAFELLLGTIPLVGSTQDLTIKCQTASIAGFSNEAFDSMLHGHVTRFRGRKMFTRSLNVTFLEVQDLSTFRTLKIWDEYISGSESGNSGGFKVDYAVQAALIIYNGVGGIAGQVDFENLFIQEVSDVQLDGQSSQAMQVSATFSYDRMLMNGIPLM